MFSQNSEKLGNGKCLRKRRPSFIGQVSQGTFALAQRPAGSQEQKRHNPYWCNSLHRWLGPLKWVSDFWAARQFGCQHTLTLKRLAHREEAEKFYCALAVAGQKVRVGMEASGHARWFERLVAELQFELWIGDAAEIRTKRVRKQKTDRQDAQLILRLLLEDRFPQIWVPSWENRDLRQLLWHRHRMVQARTRIMNQLQAVALNEGLRCKKRLWRNHGRQQLESFRLAPWPAGDGVICWSCWID
jgi:hypothetical protein